MMRTNWRKPARIILLWFLPPLWFLFSCDLLQQKLQQPRKYRVNAPQFPSGWLQQRGLQFAGWQWQVEYFGTSHANQALMQRTETHTAGSIQIDLKKQESAIVQAFPRFQGFPHNLQDSSKIQWRPAGAQILWQNRNSDDYSHRYSVFATWPEGFMSHVLSRLLRAGFDIRYLNTEKLRYYIKRRLKTQSGGTLTNPLPNPLANPWAYDLPYLLDQLGRLEMDWYDIRPRKRIKIQDMPNTGRWQPLNVAQNILDCPTGPCQPELGIGLHYYFELNSRRLWQLEVEPDGEVLGIALR